MSGLRSDFTRRIAVDTNRLEWQASPSATVWRKRLDLVGEAESGRVTSVVRYDPEASFPAHDHPDGEEILVVSGTFSDERGDFPAGTYMLNPEGFRHAPFSREGCVLFVKLRQYGGAGRQSVLIQTRDERWQPRGIDGIDSIPLYSSPAHHESVRLTRLAPGTVAPLVELPLGEEIFVLEGELRDDQGTYPAGTWLRLPRRAAHTPSSPVGCTLYVKAGGFPPD